MSPHLYVDAVLLSSLNNNNPVYYYRCLRNFGEGIQTVGRYSCQIFKISLEDRLYDSKDMVTNLRNIKFTGYFCIAEKGTHFLQGSPCILKLGAGWLWGVLKLFSEKCVYVYVCMYVCMYVGQHSQMVRALAS